jgi:hypothetical protein
VFIMTNGQDTPRETTTEHIFHTIQQAILSIAIAAVAGVIVGIVAAEVVAAALTQSAPGWPTHVIALAVGLLLGYAAAASITIWELVVGLAETIRAIGGDLERASERVIHELETLAGVQGHQSDANRPAATVEGSLALRDQPAMMRGILAVPTVPVTSTPVVSRGSADASAPPGREPTTSGTGLKAPLVPIDLAS